MTVEEMKSLLTKNYNDGVHGQFECNGHFYVYLGEDKHLAYEYYCCDADNCNSGDYEKYDSLEELFNIYDLDYGCEWHWIGKEED